MTLATTYFVQSEDTKYFVFFFKTFNFNSEWLQFKTHDEETH